MIYRNAFMKHDADRFGEFVRAAAGGAETINSAALFPYDIVEKVMEMTWRGIRVKEDDVLEAQWRQLPDYVEAGTNALVIADTSGSMYGRPMATSVGLAVYFAERNTGPYHNMFMSFSGTSRIQMLKYQHERLGEQHESSGRIQPRAGDRREEPCGTGRYAEVPDCYLRHGDRLLR